MRTIRAGLGAALVGGILHLSTPAVAVAEDLAVDVVLVSERVEQLPAGPHCWAVNVNTAAVGGSAPSEGYHQHGLNLVYQLEGVSRTETTEGRVLSNGPGGGWFLEPGVPHFHQNIGPTSTVTITFALTCGPPLQLGVTRLERVQSEPLPGIAAGPLPYHAELRQVVMPTGTKTSERFSSDPVTAYVVDGTIALNTPDGDRVNEAGNLFVIEPGAPYQFTAVGDVPSHLLLATLIPVAE